MKIFSSHFLKHFRYNSKHIFLEIISLINAPEVKKEHSFFLKEISINIKGVRIGYLYRANPLPDHDQNNEVQHDVPHTYFKSEGSCQDVNLFTSLYC